MKWKRLSLKLVYLKRKNGLEDVFRLYKTR